MGNNGNATNGVQEPISIEALLREAAFEAWVASREEHQDKSREFFDLVYLGHYASVDHVVETMVDAYGLDAKLDAAISPPFREFVDIDIPSLARHFVAIGSLYTLSASPLGVWVFNGDIE